ncbi:hypothetical protein M514_00062 [Trichuris suis]|uniref:Uncharacterized protein n=1 Tax=Trichuris suis TaxID=68888 RepID=A0A085MNV3_9BILA|nr:hypothetical protein M513_00062 [Trichuris suis]KFD72925.1 hypothetical protein M514_00062 [Trichuris suis]
MGLDPDRAPTSTPKANIHGKECCSAYSGTTMVSSTIKCWNQASESLWACVAHSLKNYHVSYEKSDRNIRLIIVMSFCRTICGATSCHISDRKYRSSSRLERVASCGILTRSPCPTRLSPVPVHGAWYARAALQRIWRCQKMGGSLHWIKAPDILSQ